MPAVLTLGVGDLLDRFFDCWHFVEHRLACLGRLAFIWRYRQFFSLFHRNERLRNDSSIRFCLRLFTDGGRRFGSWIFSMVGGLWSLAQFFPQRFKSALGSSHCLCIYHLGYMGSTQRYARLMVPLGVLFDGLVFHSSTRWVLGEPYLVKVGSLLETGGLLIFQC